MASWGKLKGLFWQAGDGAGAPPGVDAGGAAPSAGELSEDEFRALLEGSPLAVPQGKQGEPVDAQGIQLEAVGESVKIDFQAQYDAAGIPDTDEVEQLENFLQRLDPSLPQVSKIAAAQAFLGAIGKDKVAVLGDAERKILRVRAILAAKQEQAQQALSDQQAAIDALQSEIEAHRTRIQQINREMEGVRQACVQEEARLQAARVFFGSVQPVAPEGGKR